MGQFKSCFDGQMYKNLSIVIWNLGNLQGFFDTPSSIIVDNAFEFLGTTLRARTKYYLPGP
jgi:hypothetical protein